MITLCVPTKNRPVFLGRLLRYYARTGYRYWLFIGDSSDPQQADRNERMVASLAGQLKIAYHHYPGLSSCAALEQLSRHVATPYSALVCDDDFVCPTGLDRCMAFLGEHPDYGAAHGKGLMLMTERGAPYGSIGTVKSFPQPILESSTGSERLRVFLTRTPPALLYSVHRTDTWRAMFRGLHLLGGVDNRNMFKDELIASCVSVIRGKVKELDGLYLIRQPHVEDSLRFPHVYDWITDPAWFPSYQLFHDRVVQELIRQDRISPEEAQTVMREGFWHYLVHEVIGAWQKEQAGAQQVPSSRLRAVIKRIPGLRRIWRGVRLTVQRYRDELSLPALLQPTSPYHADFRPVYEVITSPPAERAEGGRIESGLDEIALAGAGGHG